MSPVVGTKRTCPSRRSMSAFGAWVLLGPLRPARSTCRRYLAPAPSASRREGNVGWPSHLVAICTACGAPLEDPRFINERCTRRVDGRRCKGTYGITMSRRDWKRCGSCSGLGFRGDGRCNSAGEPGGRMSARKITDERSVEIAYGTSRRFAAAHHYGSNWGRLGATPEPIAPNQHEVRCVATGPTVPGPQSPNHAGSCFSPYGRSYGRHVLVREFCVLLS